MPIKIIGKSILGDLGFSQVPSKMGNNFQDQLQKILENIPSPLRYRLFMTSMTGSEEIKRTNGAYYPKIRKVYPDNHNLFNPLTIYNYCEKGEDKFRPGCDFIVCDSKESVSIATFSREAPILAFESKKGKAIGTILRPSLMKYGDYLFSSIKEELGADIEVSLVTCNHFEYPEGSIPSIIESLTLKYNMKCFICVDSEKDSDCYHRGEAGNHVVVMW